MFGDYPAVDDEGEEAGVMHSLGIQRSIIPAIRDINIIINFFKKSRVKK